MNPGFEVRLSSMRRALATVIMPAIDPGNPLAQEQAGLMLAHIGMLEAQWDKLEDYARLCVQDLIEVSGRIDAAGGPETLAAAAGLAALAGTPPVRGEVAYRALSEALEGLVRAVDRDGDAALTFPALRTVTGPGIIAQNHPAFLGALDRAGAGAHDDDRISAQRSVGGQNKHIVDAGRLAEAMTSGRP
jgi:hypothetical protein